MSYIIASITLLVIGFVIGYIVAVAEFRSYIMNDLEDTIRQYKRIADLWEQNYRKLYELVDAFLAEDIEKVRSMRNASRKPNRKS